MITTSFSGKLFVCGEFSVVYGGPAIIMAVKQSLTSTIMETTYPGIEIDTDLNTDILQFQSIEAIESLKHVRTALEIAKQYLAEQNIKLKNFKIEIRSELQHDNLKFGFGSSGVVTVAMIDSVLKFHQIEVDALTLYKLAYLSLVLLKERGSKGDVATAVYGGWIYYQAPDYQWVEERFKSESLGSMIAIDWPNLRIETIKPYQRHCLVGFSGKSHSTEDSLTLIEKYRHNHPEDFAKQLDLAKYWVNQAKEGLETDQQFLFLEAIDQYRSWMCQLEEKSGCLIETGKLTDLVNIAKALNYHAKVSGAGGGDCGIAFGCDDYIEVYKQWERAGIIPIDVKEGEV